LSIVLPPQALLNGTELPVRTKHFRKQNEKKTGLLAPPVPTRQKTIPWLSHGMVSLHTLLLNFTGEFVLGLGDILRAGVFDIVKAFLLHEVKQLFFLAVDIA